MINYVKKKIKFVYFSILTMLIGDFDELIGIIQIFMVIDATLLIFF